MSKTSDAGRNELCPCGSGKKYKKCCALKQRSNRGNSLMLLIVGLLIAGVIAGISSFTSDRPAGNAGQVWSPEHGHWH